MLIRIFVVLLVFTFPSYSFGDKFAPQSSYIVISSNQKYVFVMIAPLSAERDASNWIEPKKNEIIEIRRKYSKSGMYLNDESNTLLWSVDWYRYGVEISNDGVSVISTAGMASEMESTALTFYSNGNPVQSYTVNQLVKNKRKMQHTASHFFWEKESLFDREKNRYYIETLDEMHYIFDTSNGAIISSSK